MADPGPSTTRLSASVFVRGLKIQAEIGIHPHEIGRRQPLLVDVEMELRVFGWRSISETVNYERVGEHARAIAASGHIFLVETFAYRLAQACLIDANVMKVRVRVEKPLALATEAAAAGVEITLSRD